MKNYIIGGGLTGLIASYLTGYQIIDSVPGGQLDTPFPLGPRILELTKETEQLLHSLFKDEEIPSPRTFRIGYRMNRKLMDDPPEKFREMYYYYTRGVKAITSSCMSGNKREIIGFDMSEPDLLSRLLIRVPEICYHRVIDIGNHVLTLDNHREIEFDHIISTIPLPILCGLTHSKIEHNFFSHSTTFVYIKSYSELTGDYDYVYNMQLEAPYHRITRVDECHYVLEARTDRFLSSPAESLGQRFMVNGCQIVHDLSMEKLGDITLLGRYAQWNHGIKTEHVVRRLMELEQMEPQRIRKSLWS